MDYRPDPILIKLTAYDCTQEEINISNCNTQPNKYIHYISYDNKVYADIFDHDNEVKPVGEVIDSMNCILKIYKEILQNTVNKEDLIMHYNT